MAIQKITGAQRDFSGGELDESMKRSDENPVMKTGARQMPNWRVLSSGAVDNRPGRRALFLETGRVEEVLMSPGNVFFIVFGPGYLRVYNASGVQVFSSTVKGDGSTPIPWTLTTCRNVSFVIAPGAQFQIYIAYADGAPNNPPQILSWDGVSQSSTWKLTTYAETVSVNGAKDTIFTRISPPNVQMQPSGTNGSITITFSAPILVPAMIGTRLLWSGQQITITGVSSPTVGTATVDQTLPNGQEIGLGAGLGDNFFVGDEVVGSTSGAKGIVTLVLTSDIFLQPIPGANGFPIYFVVGETIFGPNGYAVAVTQARVPPFATAIWDDEVMNLFRGYPTSVFYDQSRLGFCNFPAVPSGVGWATIGLPLNFLVTSFSLVTPDSAMFELAPGKSQVLFVQPGAESSEFVFCDNAIYYIPISPTVPLQPGSVTFTLMSQQGCQPNVRPQPIEQSILYVKAGGAQMGAVQAPGAYYRPYIIDHVSEYHSHLFTASPAIAIAAPPAMSQFEELYAYVLLANGSIAMAKYAIRNGLLDVGPEGRPKMGWLPWSGAGSPSWISAQGSDVVFTTNYSLPASGSGFSSGFSNGFGGATAISVVEVLDNNQYLDSSILVNSPPIGIPTPGGKGPLWWLAGASVTLMDQSTRMMGTYQIDANGKIIPQNNAGENLLSAQLVAGQPWTATLEPFVPDAPPGQSAHQRMFKRRVSRMAVYVSNSTGFLMARLFSGPLSRTSPALGTIMNFFRVTAWNQDDDPTQPPPLREEADRWRPIGRSYDPRVAVIKDTPGPLRVHEFGCEVSI